MIAEAIHNIVMAFVSTYKTFVIVLIFGATNAYAIEQTDAERRILNSKRCHQMQVEENSRAEEERRKAIAVVCEFIDKNPSGRADLYEQLENQITYFYKTSDETPTHETGYSTSSDPIEAAKQARRYENRNAY